MRKYVLAYATEHDLLGAAISDETPTKALANMIQDTAFPVELAKSTSVVKAVLLGTRFTSARRSRNQFQATEAPDERLGALDSDGDVAVTHCKKRKSRSTSSVAVDDDGDNDMDHQAPNNKRNRKSVHDQRITKKAKKKLTTPVGLEPTIFATGKQRLTIRPRCPREMDEILKTYVKYNPTKNAVWLSAPACPTVYVLRTTHLIQGTV